MILRTRWGRYRVKVKNRGVIVADRTFARWNDTQRWEADSKHRGTAGRLAPAPTGRAPQRELTLTRHDV